MGYTSDYEFHYNDEIFTGKMIFNESDFYWSVNENCSRTIYSKIKEYVIREARNQIMFKRYVIRQGKDTTTYAEAVISQANTLIEQANAVITNSKILIQSVRELIQEETDECIILKEVIKPKPELVTID